MSILVLPPIKVLDHGYVAVTNVFGNDISVVKAARLSYLKTKDAARTEEQDKKLLHYLYKHRHTSPFEMCGVTLQVKLPIFVMRQWIRHRTMSYNEVSARYSEMPEEFYFPMTWRRQDTKNKQGSVADQEYWNPVISWDTESNGMTATASCQLEHHCSRAYAVYKAMLSEGIAREMARMILPVNLYTEMVCTCDLHNLLHFLRLRLDPHAQYEMRLYAEAVEDHLTHLFPWTMEAFSKYKVNVSESDS